LPFYWLHIQLRINSKIIIVVFNWIIFIPLTILTFNSLHVLFWNVKFIILILIIKFWHIILVGFLLIILSNNHWHIMASQLKMWCLLMSLLLILILIAIFLNYKWTFYFIISPLHFIAKLIIRATYFHFLILKNIALLILYRLILLFLVKF